ncbi:alpha/beta hydrolase [Aquimarina sp. 2201CG5-10]|uniref:alpha/beta hydrolase n=1 Tax=Aquimarina callyspongiae TaxID=3098150 RepID=UPI002AB361DB|nr:alpha/beta hydrolase [Aquimarina sp. 2201CG5-10]MDY8137709.1 alpha/beta hydrolase [Aquimarina sp. 2201CG5-10]
MNWQKRVNLKTLMTPNNQLDLRSQHPDFQFFLDINENESERIRKSYNCYLDLKYGESPLQSLDIFPSNIPNSPILIFIHGGYWRSLDKKSYSFVAEPFIKNDITTCIINYRLIPTVNMETVLSDIAASIQWIQKKAFQYNGNSNEVILSGHSAGGHLALMTYLMNENLRSNIKAIYSLSGIFDLAPIKNSYLNEVLQLSQDDVETYSVSNKDLSHLKCPVLLSVGSNETIFFIEESKNLYTKNRLKASIEYYEYQELNHYQIVHKLGQEDSSLVNLILEKIKKL